jgi:hypothetical protein
MGIVRGPADGAFVHVEFAENDHARRPKFSADGGVFGDRMQTPRAISRRQAFDIDVVFERDGEAVDGGKGRALTPALIRRRRRASRT